jgi:hypothetical protein
MRRRTVSFALLAGVFALVLADGERPAHASPGAVSAARSIEIFPLSRIRRGQTGYGLTTMQGVAPERFEFEVIGVTRNFLPKMDIILVKSKDKKLETTGFWQGMSGSPLFIDGKLACAFSYGFRSARASGPRATSARRR